MSSQSSNNETCDNVAYICSKLQDLIYLLQNGGKCECLDGSNGNCKIHFFTAYLDDVVDRVSEVIEQYYNPPPYDQVGSDTPPDYSIVEAVQRRRMERSNNQNE